MAFGCRSLTAPRPLFRAIIRHSNQPFHLNTIQLHTRHASAVTSLHLLLHNNSFSLLPFFSSSREHRLSAFVFRPSSRVCCICAARTRFTLIVYISRLGFPFFFLFVAAHAAYVIVSRERARSCGFVIKESRAHAKQTRVTVWVSLSHSLSFRPRFCSRKVQTRAFEVTPRRGSWVSGNLGFSRWRVCVCVGWEKKERGV